MFKYAPGMESGLGAALNMMRKHAEPDGDEGTTVTNIFNMEDKKSGMNDIAGLMALMQNNKGMDLPGILGADNCQRIIGLHDRISAVRDCCCEMNQRFDRLDCKLDNMQRDSEIARLTRENEALKNKAIADSTAASVVQSLQGFAISHYKPTQTATAPTA